MDKNLIRILLLVFLCSCQVKTPLKLENPVKHEDICVEDHSSEINLLMKSEMNYENENFEYDIFDTDVSLSAFDQTQEEKVQLALDVLKKIVESEEFHQHVLHFTYKGKENFVNNNNLTNQQIYEKIREGKEVLKPEVDFTLNMDLILYYARSSTIGYTYGSTTKVWLNSKYFNNRGIPDIAATIFHEWTHKLGFGHDQKNTKRRPFSVPYGVGSIIKSLATQYIQ